VAKFVVVRRQLWVLLPIVWAEASETRVELQVVVQQLLWLQALFDSEKNLEWVRAKPSVQWKMLEPERWVVFEEG